MAKKKKIAESGPSLFDLPDPVIEEAEIVMDPIDIPEELKIGPVKTVKLREGEILAMGDEVFCLYPDERLAGKVFVITEMTEYKYCESGVDIIATAKDEPELKTITKLAENGLDANWFKKVR